MADKDEEIDLNDIFPSDSKDSKEEWTEAGGASGNSWKPENIGDRIQGTYTELKKDVGINKSNVYQIQELEKEEPTSVWGSTVLDTKFQEINVGAEVLIEFLGNVKGSGPKPYKDFKVLYKPNV